MKSNKKTKKRRTQHYRTRQYKNTYNKTKNKKQYGGTVSDTVNTVNDVANNINNAVQTGQMVASATDEEQNQEPGDGVVEVVENSGDKNTPIGKAINDTFNEDGDQPAQPAQPAQSDELQKYLQYIQDHPTFIQSTLSNVVVKPTAYLINELASLLNVDMNNPHKLKTQLDEMADSIQDPDERNKVLNYNAQVLAVYLSASKPSIDIISGIFSQEVSEVLGDITYNAITKLQNMIPIFAIPQLLNEIPLMLMSIVQAATTLAQLTSSGATSTQQNLQQLNKSIMNEVDVKNKLVIEQKKQAEILEKQNKLVEFILEKPEIIDHYIEYLNKYKNEKLTVNDIIPNSSNITDPDLDANLDLPSESELKQPSETNQNQNQNQNMTGGKTTKPKITNRINMDKEHDNLLYAIKESLNEYNKKQSK
jgi:hypothetical protein